LRSSRQKGPRRNAARCFVDDLCFAPMLRLRGLLGLRLALFVAVLSLVGCGGPGRVQYDGGRCLEDGRALAVQDVEVEQTRVARRIASRQPWFAVITIGVVLLAAAGNAEKALLLVRERHLEGHRAFAERLRDVLVRQRENPVRFAAIIGGSLALIGVAGGAYVYLDIDKRASERALATLQYCHLAMRTQEEEGVLGEQRRNLEAIQSTAGDIKTLVAKLPPDEQRKAQLFVEQMNVALTKQGKIVGDYAARTDEAQRDLSTHTVAVEKGLASVEGDLAELRSLPAGLKDLGSAAHRIDETTTALDARFGAVGDRIAAVDAKLDTLLARPACVPAPTPSTTSKPLAAAAASTPGSPKAAPPAIPGPDGGSREESGPAQNKKSPP
jgi:hypothetical protein